MNFNNRSDYLQGILNALNGLYYYLNDFNSTGILYYEVGDLYNVQIGENIYQCLMLNDEVNVTTGIEEIVHTDMPEKSETDYSKADKTDMRINKTYLIVDKQNQTIESVVNNVTEQNNKISQITQTVDEINSKISDIADITTYGESDRALVELTDINESEPIMIKVHPTSTNISYLYPRDNLYPSDTQYMPNRIIRFTRTYEEEGQTLTEDIDYTLPDNLLRYSDTVYDEFYLDYDSTTCQVIKRCAYNADGTVRALGTETTIDYPYPTIALGEGNYTITLLGYDFGYIYARLMAKNIYTTQFYTKVETDSRINQKADEINLGVSQTLTNYSTTNEMNSAITLKANEITSTVSNTYETKNNAQSNYSQLQQTANNISSVVSTKVGEDEIISKINQSSEAVTIDANKIKLNGKTIDLTGQDIKIASTNFNVDKNGNVTANSLSSSNANITGGNIHLTNNGSNDPAVLLDTLSGATILLTPSYNNQPALSITGSNDVEVLVGANDGIQIVNDGRVLFKVNKNTGKIFTDDTIESSYIYYNETVTNEPNMYITSSGNFRRTTNTSSQRYKKDIKELENEELKPEKLYDLPVRQFKYKKEYQPNEKDCRYNKDLIGFIAEDVAEIYPIATDYNENGEVENWNARYMIPAMLKLIQEQHTEIEQMKEEIKELKGEK